MTALVDVVVLAAVVDVAAVLPVITLLERRRAGTGPEVEATAEDVALLPEIRDPLEAQQRR